jgi:Flp pilus assembly protein TadG
MPATPTNMQARVRGTAIVEAAIVLPLLLLLAFGAIEYGWMFVVYGGIVNAARQGARVAITPNATLTDASNQIDTALNNAGLSLSNAQKPYSISYSPITIGGTTNATIVTVGVQYNYVPLTGGYVPVPSTLHATVVMMMEGPAS